MIGYIENSGEYEWIVGRDDNVDSDYLRALTEPNFVFALLDATGELDESVPQNGYVNGELHSRGFKIRDPVPPSSLTTSSTASISTSTPSSLPPSGTPTVVPPGDGDSLTQGAKIGIGVGAGVGGLLLVVLSVLVTILAMRRRWRKAEGVPGPSVVDVTTESNKPPVRYQYQPELGDNHYVELPVDPHVSVGR